MLDTDTQEQRAERGRNIMAGVREWEAAEKARAEAFAQTVQSEKKKYVHRRDPAAAMVSEAIGGPYSGELLRRTDTPFVVRGRIAYYCDDDLRVLAERILDSAPLRHGKPDRPRRRAA